MMKVVIEGNSETITHSSFEFTDFSKEMIAAALSCSAMLLIEKAEEQTGISKAQLLCGLICELCPETMSKLLGDDNDESDKDDD